MKQLYAKTINSQIDQIRNNIQLLYDYLMDKLDIHLLTINLINRSEAKKIEIINDLIHMTNNRLGVFNHDESYLAYINLHIR